MSNYLRYFILFVSICNGLFVNYPSKNGMIIKRWNDYNRLAIIPIKRNPLLLTCQNKSKIYKIVFDNDIESDNDKLFTLNLSFAVYIVILYTYCYSIYYNLNLHNH